MKILSIVTNKIKQGYITLTFFFLKEDCDLIAFDFTQDSQWGKKKKMANKFVEATRLPRIKYTVFKTHHFRINIILLSKFYIRLIGAISPKNYGLEK